MMVYSKDTFSKVSRKPHLESMGHIRGAAMGNPLKGNHFFEESFGNGKRKQLPTTSISASKVSAEVEFLATLKRMRVLLEKHRCRFSLFFALTRNKA